MTINYNNHDLITNNAYKLANGSAIDKIGAEIFVCSIFGQEALDGVFPDITIGSASVDIKSGYNSTDGYYTFQESGLYIIEAQSQFYSMCVNDRSVSAFYINEGWNGFGETIIAYYKSDWGTMHSTAMIRPMSEDDTIALATFVDGTQATCEDPPQTRLKAGQWRIFKLNN